MLCDSYLPFNMDDTENPSWQAQCSTLRERVEYAFNNSLFPDVEFTVEDSEGETEGETEGEKVVVTVSKFILSVSSPVFEAMFQGKLAEKGPTIHLPDCSKDGLQELLRYVHSDQVNLTGSNVMEVLYLADKYMIPLLRDKCYEYLANRLTPSEVFSVLTQSQQSGNKKAEELCWNVVDFKTHQAMTSQAFLNISRELLRQILERETLHTDELNIFKAVNAWASDKIEEESKKEDGDAKRSVLGDEIICLIRFPAMSQRDFADIVLVKDILRGNEVTEVVQIFNSIPPSQDLFKSVKRKGQWNELWTKNRFDAVDTKHCGDQQQHSIVFQVNKPIFLAGVRIFGIQSDAKDVTTMLTILSARGKSQLFQTKVCLDSKQNIEGSYFGHSVIIAPPILLLSQERYRITLSAIVIPTIETVESLPVTASSGFIGSALGPPRTVQDEKFVQAQSLFSKPKQSPSGRRSKSGMQSVVAMARSTAEELGSHSTPSLFVVPDSQFVFQPKQSSGSTTTHLGSTSPARPKDFTSYLGSGGKSQIECDDIKITFINNEEESDPGTTIYYGQFPSFLLKRQILLKD